MTLQARPTLYKGIQMRSRLEAQYASWLDHFHMDWQYEPQCYASPSGQYLPDFVLSAVNVCGRPETVIVETKPTAQHAYDAQMSGRMLIALEQGITPAPVLVIQAPGRLVMYRTPGEDEDRVEGGSDPTWRIAQWGHGWRNHTPGIRGHLTLGIHPVHPWETKRTGHGAP